MNPFNHEEAELWATAAATGGLNEAEAQLWTEHLGTCPSCKQLNDEELALCHVLDRVFDAESPGPGFEQRIMDRLYSSRAGSEAHWYDFFRINPILAAAACVTIVAVASVALLVRPVKRASALEAKLDALPAAVRNAIQTRTDGEQVNGLEQDTEDGQVSYTVTATAFGGSPSSFTVAADGTLLSTDITLAAIPQPVRDGISAQLGSGKLAGLEEDLGDGEPQFVATIASPDGKQRDFTFNGEGTLDEVETSMAELPAAAQAAINAQVGQGTLEAIDKAFDGGGIQYVATITSPDGHERDFTFDEDGTLSSMEVSLDELPAPLQAAIKAQTGTGRLDGIDKAWDGGTVDYEAGITAPDGLHRNISLSPQGALLSREVAMTEAPPTVQQTVSQTLGNGKLIEIDQLFAGDDTGVPYEIEASKDGKPFYFLVSPTGHFLGMED
jgi:hypothetical protein